MSCVDLGKNIYSSSEMSESEAVHSDYKNCEEAENVQRLSSFCTIMNNKVPCQKDSKATRKRAIEDAILK